MTEARSDALAGLWAHRVPQLSRVSLKVGPDGVAGPKTVAASARSMPAPDWAATPVAAAIPVSAAILATVTMLVFAAWLEMICATCDPEASEATAGCLMQRECG